MYVFGSGGHWMRGLGFNQSCENRGGGGVGRVSVFWLRWCR